MALHTTLVPELRQFAAGGFGMGRFVLIHHWIRFCRHRSSLLDWSQWLDEDGIFFCYNGGVAAFCGNIMRMFFLCYVHLSIGGISLNCLPTFSGCPLKCRWLKGLPRVVIWCCIQFLDGCWRFVFRFTASVLMGRCCSCFRLRRSQTTICFIGCLYEGLSFGVCWLSLGSWHCV